MERVSLCVSSFMLLLSAVDQTAFLVLLRYKHLHSFPLPTNKNKNNSWVLKGKESRLSIELVFHLHQGVDPASDVDIDEIECLLANSIYKGNIRGYIAHYKRILVLSKDNPFPSPQQK